MVDDLVTSLGEPMLSARDTLRADVDARLDLTRSRTPAPVEITLTGPLGSARVPLDLRLDAPEAPMHAINAQTHLTGITATMAEDGSGLRLSSTGAMEVTGQTGGSRTQPVVAFGPADGPAQRLRPMALGANALVGAASAALDHMGLMRAEAGSLADAVDKASETIASRRLTVDQAVAGLQDIDIAETVTRLQSLLLTQQASQQSFVKISGQSLFNFIR